MVGLEVMTVLETMVALDVALELVELKVISKGTVKYPSCSNELKTPRQNDGITEILRLRVPL